MNLDINEAKRRLPMPDLLARLGLSEHAKKSARCPWPHNHKHDDKSPSFGIEKKDSGWVFNCFVCGGGDEITFLEKHEGLSRGDAMRRYCELAGVNGMGGMAPASERSKKPPEFRTDPNPFCLLPKPDAEFADVLAGKLRVNPATIQRLIGEGALGFKSEYTFWRKADNGEKVAVESSAIVFACQHSDGSGAGLHLRGKAPDGERLLAWDSGDGAQLWRLPAVSRATKGVILTEGETDAIAALDTGIEADGYAIVAKTGARIFPNDALPVFAGKVVFVIPDNDKGGREGAAKTAEKLREVTEVHVAALPEMPEGKKDLRDWLGLGNGKVELLALLDKARLPRADVVIVPTQKVSYGLSKQFCYDLGGWIGDYFALFEPRTEPSYAFHLAGALACMDVVLGRRVFWPFGNSMTYPQNYYLLAGSVAAARKSTALGCAARVINCLETEAMPYRLADGFSYESMPDEFAEWSQRIWLLDEFSSLLIQQQKEYGRGIGQTLNSMWAGVDRIRLRFRGRDKDKAAVIENPTLTMLAATSLELLQSNLKAGDHGGFTSRLFTFYAEGDSKDLPEPPPIEQHEVEALANKLRRLTESARGKAGWTPEAMKVWSEWYCAQKSKAAKNPSGFGSRKGDHVRKTAMKLQISRDGTTAISEWALVRAIAIADQAEESWRKVFGAGHTSGGFIAAKATEALDWIRAHACPAGIPMWKLSRGLNLDKPVFDKVIQTLQLWEEIHREDRITQGRPAALIWPTKLDQGKKQEV